MIKVILVENHIIVRNGIKALLEKYPDIKVVMETDNSQQILKKVREGLKADVILIDLNIPGISGTTLIEELNYIAPEVKVLVLSMLDDERYMIKVIRNGARGFLLKNVSEEELIFSIKHVKAGNLYICSELVARVLPVVSDRMTESVFADQKLTAGLSKKERDVLHLVADGFTNRQIAEKLFSSRRTIEGLRQSLLGKTGTNNTATLIRFAMRNGLIN